MSIRGLVAEAFILLDIRRRYDETIRRLRRELHEAHVRLAQEDDQPIVIPKTHRDRVANLKATIEGLVVRAKSSEHGYMSPEDQAILRTALAVVDTEIDGLG